MTTTTEPLQIKWKLFIPWLESQPKDKSFEYRDNYNCIICQFVKETHGEIIIAGGTFIQRRYSLDACQPIPDEIANALEHLPYPSTVGDLLARLKPPA
jgi:hypothetical protein